MGTKISLQQETLPTTLMLNEPQSAVLWNQQIQNRWHTPYDELPNQIQNFSISSLSVMITILIDIFLKLFCSIYMV